jgi:hypothetical protein
MRPCRARHPAPGRGTAPPRSRKLAQGGQTTPEPAGYANRSGLSALPAGQAEWRLPYSPQPERRQATKATAPPAPQLHPERVDMNVMHPGQRSSPASRPPARPWTGCRTRWTTRPGAAGPSRAVGRPGPRSGQSSSAGGCPRGPRDGRQASRSPPAPSPVPRPGLVLSQAQAAGCGLPAELPGEVFKLFPAAADLGVLTPGKRPPAGRLAADGRAAGPMQHQVGGRRVLTTKPLGCSASQLARRQVSDVTRSPGWRRVSRGNGAGNDVHTPFLSSRSPFLTRLAVGVGVEG